MSIDLGRSTNGSTTVKARSPLVKTAPARLRAERRLTRRDWIEAGQEVLRADGIHALKLATLTRWLGVSTGSFYHHFPDFENYLGALAESYNLDSIRGVLARAVAESPDPLVRVRKLAQVSLKEGTFDLDRAMRIWATMDPRAAAAVRKAEALILAFIVDALRDLGFDEDEALLRARVLMSVNVAQLGVPEGRSRREFFKNSLRLLTSRST